MEVEDLRIVKGQLWRKAIANTHLLEMYEGLKKVKF